MNTHGCLGWVVGDVVVEEGLPLMNVVIATYWAVVGCLTFGLVGVLSCTV